MRLAPGRKETLAALLYCLAATALFFRGPLFLRRQFHIPYDLEEFHQPLSELIAWSLREFGRLPWWNPFSYMGEPFFANVQAAMFYPPTLLIVLIGNLLYGRVTFWLMEVQLIAHVILAGVGAFVLLRRLGVNVRAALAGAAVYHLGAFFASQTQHLGAISGAGWLPWFLAALHRLEERRDGRSAALAGLALAMMIMTGFPPAYMPALVFGAFLYGMWVVQAGRAPGSAPPSSAAAWARLYVRPAVLFGVVLLLAALLTSVSWLPGYQVGKRSLATARPPAQALDGLMPEAATSFFWPNLFNQLRGDYWLKENTTFLHLYQGIPALLLVLGALGWLAGSRRARPFLLAAGVALLWMFGRTFFVAQLFYLLFPRFMRRGIYPQYILAYFSLFFAVLAALALDAWERGERGVLFRSQLCRRAAALAVIVALVISAAGAFAPQNSPFGARAAASGASLLLVALSLALCAWLASRQEATDPAARRRLASAFCAVILFDLLALGSHTGLNTYAGEGDPVSPSVTFVQQKQASEPLYRIDSSELGYNWQTKVPQWRVRSANGMNPLMLRDTLIYRAPYSRIDDRQFSLELPDSPLLDLAGVRYIASIRDSIPGMEKVFTSDLNIFENRRAFPRFFLVGGVIAARDVGDAVRMIHTREADPARVAVVLAADVGRFPALPGPATSAEIGEVKVLAEQPNEIRLQIRASRPAVLVAIESYWPDWRATVDGAPHDIIRADGIFRAIAVPAGTHQVRMFIVPLQLYLGAAFSALGIVLAALLLALPAARRPAPLATQAASGEA